MTARDWALIGKDPEAHSGERVMVYGMVTHTTAPELEVDTITVTGHLG